MAEVRLDKVSKVYPGGVRAVDGVDLRIRDGEFVVLVGPSGCGKSTTLRMVAGLEDITSGTISIGERVVNDVAPKDRDIAMVFQNYALYPHMTVYRNMAFGLKLRRTPRKEIDERVRAAAKVLGVESLLQRKPGQLSGGQRQRVAVGRAIVRDPACFLFDEPLSNLDAKLRVEMRAELKRLHRRLQTTTIYVTHDQEEAMTLGDRVVVMHDGVVQQCDAPLKVYRHPRNRFVAGFMGTPPMNFLTGQLVGEEGSLWFDAGSARLRVPAWARPSIEDQAHKEIVLGVRPEAMTIVDPGEAADDAETIAATVDVVEILGDRIDVSMRTPHQPKLIARVDARPDIEPESTVRLRLDPARLHFFSAEATGENLAYRAETRSAAPTS